MTDHPRLFELVLGGTRSPDREEQFRVLIHTRGTVAPIHGFSKQRFERARETSNVRESKGAKGGEKRLGEKIYSRSAIALGT